MQVTVHTAGRWESVIGTVRDMSGWWTRRPLTRTAAGVRPADEVVLGHSAELRTVMFLLIGSEVLVEGLMDVHLVPPAWRPVHLIWLALLVDLSIAFAAVTKRHPHRITAEALHLRAGLHGEVVVPLAAVAGVRRERVTAKGLGLRPLPDRPDAALCNVTGTAELVLDLHDPVDLRLAGGTRLAVRRLHLAVDDPGTAHRQLLRAVQSAAA